jgi:hypothetical protein
VFVLAAVSLHLKSLNQAVPGPLPICHERNLMKTTSRFGCFPSYTCHVPVLAFVLVWLLGQPAFAASVRRITAANGDPLRYPGFLT